MHEIKSRRKVYVDYTIYKEWTEWRANFWSYYTIMYIYILSKQKPNRARGEKQNIKKWLNLRNSISHGIRKENITANFVIGIIASQSFHNQISWAEIDKREKLTSFHSCFIFCIFLSKLYSLDAASETPSKRWQYARRFMSIIFDNVNSSSGWAKTKGK